MFAALVLAAALPAAPLALWPEEMGPPVALVADVELYVLEPEDEFYVLAVQPLAVALERSDDATLVRLAKVAVKLGADAVLLLTELPEEAIPADPAEPLPHTGRYTMAAYLLFADQGEGDGESVRGAGLRRAANPALRRPRPAIRAAASRTRPPRAR